MSGVQFRRAALKLEVEPQITPHGRVILDLDVSKDSVGEETAAGPAIDTKHVQTRVEVENGGTVAIGGIYSADRTQRRDGRAAAGKIPVLGWLFRHRTRGASARSELVDFHHAACGRNHYSGLTSTSGTSSGPQVLPDSTKRARLPLSCRTNKTRSMQRNRVARRARETRTYFSSDSWGQERPPWAARLRAGCSARSSIRITKSRRAPAPGFRSSGNWKAKRASGSARRSIIDELSQREGDRPRDRRRRDIAAGKSRTSEESRHRHLFAGKSARFVVAHAQATKTGRCCKPTIRAANSKRSIECAIRCITSARISSWKPGGRPSTRLVNMVLMQLEMAGVVKPAES